MGSPRNRSIASQTSSTTHCDFICKRRKAILDRTSLVIILGINQDRYDSGVTLVDGNDVLYSVNEERFTRRKTQGGFPTRSLDALFEFTGVDMHAVDGICVAGLMTPPLPVRMFPKLHHFLFDGEQKTDNKGGLRARFIDFVQDHTSLAHTSSGSILRRISGKLLLPCVRRTLPKALRSKPLHFVEHHLAHAASAWNLSGMDEALCVTGDGMGDGLSMTISRCSSEGIERLWTASSRDSLGLLFEMITESFGFIPCRHEGKVMGLAAHGDAKKVQEPSPFTIVNGQLVYDGPTGRRGVAWARQIGRRYGREDIAAWVQNILELNVAGIVRDWLRKTNLTRVVAAGGIVANVKLNQRLHQLDEVEQMFVCPNMGDGGLSLGAICAQFGLRPRTINDVFWGDAISNDDVLESLTQNQLAYTRCDDIERKIAELLAEGFIVARCSGRMEWGPRALGNRSVLASTTQPGVVERLNRLLRRSDFMPFAPAVLDEVADQYFADLDSARNAAEFMTVCFDATQKMKDEHPAVTHVDGTVRPQLVRERTNPGFHRLLTEYQNLTGSGIVLNTSFNIHEEPIVRTAEHAVRSFLDAGLDYLAIEDILVTAPAGNSLVTASMAEAAE